jgi:hypothetical protein
MFRALIRASLQQGDRSKANPLPQKEGGHPGALGIPLVAASGPGSPTATAPERQKLARLQRTHGNQAVLRMLRTEAIQPKLTVGHANNPLEHDADRIADQVMRVSDHELSVRAEPPNLGRNYTCCEEEAQGLRTNLIANSHIGASEVPVDRMARRARVNVSNSSMRMTTQFVGSPPTFENWGGGVLCKSPTFALTGEVSFPPSMADGDLTAGFMQALVRCTGPKGRYWDGNDAPYMTAFAPYKTLPLRDADPSGILYGPEAQRVVDSPTVSVSMSDQPQTSLRWTTPDGKGNLQQINGEHQFVTWLVVRSDSTGELNPLRYFTWSVGWFAAVDQSMTSGTAFDIGRITELGEGKGPLTPIRSGPVVNDSGLDTRWEPWGG